MDNNINKEGLFRDLVDFPHNVLVLSEVLGDIPPASNDIVVEITRLGLLKALLDNKKELDRRILARKTNLAADFDYCDDEFTIQMPDSLIEFIHAAVVLRSNNLHSFIHYHAYEEWTTILLVYKRDQPNEPHAYVEVYDNGTHQEVFQFKTTHDQSVSEVKAWEFLVNWSHHNQTVRVDPVFLLENENISNKELLDYIADIAGKRL